MKPYPSLRDKTLDGAHEMLQYISRERDNDITEFNNLTNIFMRGRKVGKIPTSSTDIVPSDRVGDFSYDPDYLYIVINDSGTAEWRRATLGTW